MVDCYALPAPWIDFDGEGAPERQANATFRYNMS
jgi:hypothetical protein